MEATTNSITTGLDEYRREEYIVINKGMEISPFVKSMSCGVKIPTDLDYKKEYTD